MPNINIAYLDTSDAEDKLWYHGIRPEQVRAVLENRWAVMRNRQGRAADYLLIGRDEQGRCLTLAIVSTNDPQVWRVITGWYCKSSEAAKLR